MLNYSELFTVDKFTPSSVHSSWSCNPSMTRQRWTRVRKWRGERERKKYSKIQQSVHFQYLKLYDFQFFCHTAASAQPFALSYFFFCHSSRYLSSPPPLPPHSLAKERKTWKLFSSDLTFSSFVFRVKMQWKLNGTERKGGKKRGNLGELERRLPVERWSGLNANWNMNREFDSLSSVLLRLSSESWRE